MLFFHLGCFLGFALNSKSDTVSHGLVEVRWNLYKKEPWKISVFNDEDVVSLH